jgi:transposase
MRALDPEVKDAVWEAVAALIPAPVDTHPLGVHRPRADNRICFEGILIRLVTGCSWEDAERLIGGVVSDTTLRSRRTEWVEAGVFDSLANEAISAYDKIIGLDLTETALDGSSHKSPVGGEGTGKNPCDRAKLGWKWSVLSDRNSIPLGWTAGPANQHDVDLLEPTLDSVSNRGLLGDIETLWLDRGYDSRRVRQLLKRKGITDAIIAKKRRRGQKGRPKRKQTKPMGMRWPVERTNSWMSNFGQLRRNTDRYQAHRMAQIALSVAFLITGKLIDWRKRWSATPLPIR